jgi:type II secretory pathway pseudopilin PulG
MIELVVVVLVIGILAAIAVPRVAGIVNTARTNAARRSLNVVRDAILAYKSQEQALPPAATLAADLQPYLKGPFPVCPLGQNSTVAVTTQDPITTPESGGAAWVYNETTGDFHVNHAEGIAW